MNGLADHAESESLWAAVVERDPTATFVYSVASTGIYCRPRCPARRPLRDNVAFHATAAEAERLGFRPCKRCRPGDALAELAALAPVVAMCELIERRSAAPSLAELAAHVGLSPAYAHRRFVQTMGLTPKQYRAASDRQRVSRAMLKEETMTRAIYAAGFSSPARFYERVDGLLGMPARDYRRGAQGLTIEHALGACTLGAVLVAYTERGVCSVLLGDDPERLVQDLRARFPRASIGRASVEGDQLLAQVIAAIEDDGGGLGRALPLDLRGTVFQERVWRALGQISRGNTVTYRELATALGAPTSARAVARACADNPIAVLVPCHRVVRGDGSLAGYRWGIERKRELLRRESKRGEDEAAVRQERAERSHDEPVDDLAMLARAGGKVHSGEE